MSENSPSKDPLLRGFESPAKWEWKSWLALGDVPKIPVSAAGGLLGYITVTSGVSTIAILMVLYIAFLHYFIFSLNDVCDYQIDKAGNRIEKPLVNGQIGKEQAKRISVLGIVSFLVVSPFVFPWMACLILGLGTLIGVVYNRISSVTPYGPVFLGVWGVADVLFGAYVVSYPTTNTYLLAALAGVVLVHITYVGDIWDIDQDIYTLPHHLGVSQSDGHLAFPRSSLLLEICLNILKIGLLCVIVYTGHIAGFVAIVAYSIHLLYNVLYVVDDEGREYHIRRFTQTGIMTLLLAVSAYAGLGVALTLVIVTTIWATYSSDYVFDTVRAAEPF